MAQDDIPNFGPKTCPLSARCADVFRETDHALVAVSLFNGYYNKPRLRTLIDWAHSRFSQFHVPIFDAPHAYTLSAVGIPSSKAVGRARQEGRKLQRRVEKMLTDLPSGGGSAAMLTWDDMSRNPRYLELAIDTERAFHSDRRFRDACIAMTDQVNQARSLADLPESESDHQACKDVPSIKAIDSALSVRYLLSEIPLFIDTAGIVGSRSSIFCYHRSYEFYERFFSHEFAVGPNQNQAFLVVTFDDEDDCAENSDPQAQFLPAA
ncbi:MAG: tRNA-dependent cyclodipeptide synthase [Alphaproteobacteria bacterium]|nr:tRNA-dependent cyclodipeptide synthase [Alphaproteobacteria bacterium]